MKGFSKMKTKFSIYLIPMLLLAFVFYSFTSSTNLATTEANQSKSDNSPVFSAGTSVLILVHDSTVTTSITKRKADRDTLIKYIPQVVGAHTMMSFDTTTTLAGVLSSYDVVIIQETSFDAAICRYLGKTARENLKAWLLSGTPLDKKRLLMMGADLGYNYSRSGSGGRDLGLSDSLARFVYRVDNKPGSTSPAVIGVGIDAGNSRSLTSTVPGGGYWPDGCGISSVTDGLGSTLYRYQNGTANDTVAAIGADEAGYRIATMFQDPRYFVSDFGTVFEAVALWVNENTPLPVELASFISTVSGNTVTLNWSTSSELNNSGFDIERSVVENEWTKVGHVEGNGTTSELTSYSFSDRGLSTGIYNYRLKQIDFNGNYEYYNLSSEVNVGLPLTYSLSQNYPNPFNPSTKIEYALPKEGNTVLTVYDMSGKEVARLVNEFKSAGFHSVTFNSANLSSGNYFYRIVSGEFTTVKKMTLVK